MRSVSCPPSSSCLRYCPFSSISRTLGIMLPRSASPSSDFAASVSTDRVSPTEGMISVEACAFTAAHKTSAARDPMTRATNRFLFLSSLMLPPIGLEKTTDGRCYPGSCQPRDLGGISRRERALRSPVAQLPSRAEHPVPQWLKKLLRERSSSGSKSRRDSED